MSSLPRLTYGSINIDFDRALNAYSMTPIQNRTFTTSLSGISETLNFFTQHRLRIGKLRLNRSIERQINEFWEYAKSGQVFSFRFDRDLMAYFALENLTTDINGITGTFTRTGAANYIHPSTGLITSAAANTARFQAGKFGSGLLMEDAMSQVCLRTEEFDNAAWTKTGITVVANTTETLAPDGTTNADKCTLTAATGTIVQDLSGAADIGTQDGIFTVYLKWSTGTAAPGGVKLRIKRADTDAILVEDAAYQSVSPQVWTRFSIAYNNGGAIAAKWRLEIELNTDASVYYVFGANFEAARRYATSYLAAVGTATTRNTEALSYVASNFFDDEPYQGSISFWWKALHAGTNTETTLQLFILERVGSTSPALELYWTTPNLFFDAYGKDGAAKASASNSVSIVFGDWINLVVTWDTSVANSLKLYVNGTAYSSTNNRFALARRGTNFYIGSSGGTTRRANAMIDDFEIRRDVLSAAEVLARYNMGKALGWRRNYFSSLILDQDEYDPQLLVGSWRHDIELNFVEQLS